ncbi:hypothetical protein GCM10007199_22100 [Fictibacillus barbaricus]|nr:hypothetical protein GCM10007199_22100 [Fictibacillus barbaricus]
MLGLTNIEKHRFVWYIESDENDYTEEVSSLPGSLEQLPYEIAPLTVKHPRLHSDIGFNKSKSISFWRDGHEPK